MREAVFPAGWQAGFSGALLVEDPDDYREFFLGKQKEKERKIKIQKKMTIKDSNLNSSIYCLLR